MPVDINEKVAVTLTRAQWGTLIQTLWDGALCRIGMPLIELIRPQLEEQATPAMIGKRKAGTNNVVPAEDD